jgi:hypothetical protein
MKFLDSFADLIITMCPSTRAGSATSVFFPGYIVLVRVCHFWGWQIRHLQYCITLRMDAKSSRVLRRAFSLKLFLGEKVYRHQRAVGIEGIVPQLDGLNRRV